MSDRLLLSALSKPKVRVRIMDPLLYLPVGTNGYVSTWGAITGICPPIGS
jgi:hypothetical protein